MRRYWIERKNIYNDTVTFEGDLFHHIFDVCRQGKGSKFEVLFDGKAYLVEATDVKKKTATAILLEERIIPTLPAPHLKLAICVPRFNVLESVLEKAVEMGVHTVQLLTSDYSHIKASEKISDNKWDRWKKIIVSATQQCGRGELMTLVEPISLQNFVQQMDPKGTSLCLFGYEGDEAMTLQNYLRPQTTKKWGDTCVIVGAEGGFSLQEAQKLKDKAIQPVTVGDQILRVETACITLISILKYELGLMRKNK